MEFEAPQVPKQHELLILLVATPRLMNAGDWFKYGRNKVHFGNTVA